MPDGGRSCHRSCHCSSIHSSIHYMVFAWFFHAFEAACLVMSGIGVGFSSSFLWASEGDVRHFFGGWFLDRLGLNPAGVWLFRLRAERRPELPPKLPLQLHPQLHRLHGFCMVFSWFRLYPTEADVVIPWPCTARFSWLFKRFWSCLAGDVRPLRSEGNIRQFFGGWFGQVGLEPCWGLPWICLAFTGLDPVVLTGRMTKVAPCAVLVCAATKAFTLLPYPCGCSTSFPFRRFVFALYFASSLRRLDLRATFGASMGERAYHDAISDAKLLATMPSGVDLSSPNAAVRFFLAIRAFVLRPFGRLAVLRSKHLLMSLTAFAWWYALFLLLFLGY